MSTNMTSNLNERVQSNLDEAEQELETSPAYFKPKPGKAYIIRVRYYFTHSVKIEQTVKGARITVHVNANEGLEALQQSINLYSN